MKWIYFLFAASFLVACTSEETIDETVDETTQTEQPVKDSGPKLSKEESLVRHIEASLEIPATEKYDYEIFKEDCNGDGQIDWVVTVNLLDRAINEAIESERVAKRAAMGYMGRYNYIVYVDGISESMTAPLVIPSSPHAALKVSFENITSDGKKDIMVDYRIRNSGFREFLSVVNNVPKRILQLKIFDGVGSVTPEAYHVEFAPGSFSLAKDIIVYKGTFENREFEDPLAVYDFTPEITSTNELERKWFYGEQMKKYFTQKIPE